MLGSTQWSAGLSAGVAAATWQLATNQSAHARLTAGCNKRKTKRSFHCPELKDDGAAKVRGFVLKDEHVSFLFRCPRKRAQRNYPQKPIDGFCRGAENCEKLVLGYFWAIIVFRRQARCCDLGYRNLSPVMARTHVGQYPVECGFVGGGGCCYLAVGKNSIRPCQVDSGLQQTQTKSRFHCPELKYFGAAKIFKIWHGWELEALRFLSPPPTFTRRLIEIRPVNRVCYGSKKEKKRSAASF